MGLFDDFSLNFSDSFDSTDWGPSFDSSVADYTPTTDYLFGNNFDFSLGNDSGFSLTTDDIFGNIPDYSIPDFSGVNLANILGDNLSLDVNSGVYDTPNFWTSDVDTLMNQYDWNTSYDPTDVNNVAADIEKTLADSNLYSLSSGTESSGSALFGDTIVGDSSGGSAASSLNKLLSQLIKGTQSATSSPLGQLAKLALGYAARKQATNNQKARFNASVNTAKDNSQHDLTGNRRGNFTVAQRDPLSYVAPIPKIGDQ